MWYSRRCSLGKFDSCGKPVDSSALAAGRRPIPIARPGVRVQLRVSRDVQLGGNQQLEVSASANRGRAGIEQCQDDDYAHALRRLNIEEGSW